MSKKRRSWLSGEFNRIAPPTPAPKDDTVVDNYHGVLVPDPYRGFEDLDSPQTGGWSGSENGRFHKFIEGAPARQKTIDFMTRAMDYARESLPGRYGSRYFSSYNPGLAPQAVFQVRDTLDGPPRVLIDPNTLSSDGTVALSGVSVSPDGKLVAYMTSEAGSDAQTLHIRDVETGQDLPDIITGLRFTSARWDRDSSKGFQYDVPSTDGKKRFIAMHHAVGGDPAADKKVFEFDEENAFVGGFHLENGRHDYMTVSIGTESANGLWLRAEGTDEPFRKLFDHGVAAYNPVDEVDGKILIVTDHDAPNGRLVAVDPDNPGPAHWETIIPESDQDTLEGAFVHQGRLFAFFSHDCADQLKVYGLDGAWQHDVAIPENSSFGFAHANKEDKEFLLRVSDFQQAGSDYKYDIATNTLTFLKASACPENLKDCIVERLHAMSNGRKIPMTVIRHPDTVLDGSAAMKGYGYGGFRNSLGPGFSLGIANHVRQGGMYMQANLPGGGEFGRGWYEAGRLKNKQNVFDAFAACAEELERLNYTCPERMVIQGGSNGGLLVLATMEQRPELFGAAVAQVPVTDLNRFMRHTYGAAWISDYGNPQESKEDFETAEGYAPIRNTRPDHPPCLVTTGDHDDRVVPSHAFKFVATQQEKDAPESITLLRVDFRAGHGAGKPTAKMIEEMADIQAFIETAIGPIDQNEYKKALAAKLAAEAAEAAEKQKSRDPQSPAP